MLNSIGVLVARWLMDRHEAGGRCGLQCRVEHSAAQLAVVHGELLIRQICQANSFAFDPVVVRK
jgi:hypothetical protein